MLLAIQAIPSAYFVFRLSVFQELKRKMRKIWFRAEHKDEGFGWKKAQS